MGEWMLLILLPTLLLALQAGRRYHQRRAQFQRRALDKGLKPAQRRLLWKVACQQRRNPVLLLRSAPAFELCVGEYVRSGGKGSVLAELAHIRVLLDFDPLTPGQPLRSTRQLTQGQPLSLWPAGEDTGLARTCLVVSASKPDLVLTPLAANTPAWSPGTTLRASFQREQGVQYHFTTQLLARTRYSLSVQHTEQVERLQAREFLRWDTAFPLTLRIPGSNVGKQALEGTVTNIGGGGLRVQVQEEVPAGTPVVVDPQHHGPFPLAGVKGRVVAGSRTRGRAMHIQFVGLPRQTEARIVRRIYQHQLCRRSRGESRGSMRKKGE